MKLISIILASIYIVGCSSGGGDSSGGATVAPNPWSTYSVTAASDLPTCSGDIIGRLYYIESTNTFQACKSTGWATINVKGNDGTSGMSISSNVTCSKTTGGATFYYRVTKFNTGDKFVYCAISNSADTYSSNRFYMAAQNGATDEGCLLTYDIDTAGSGFWSFIISGTTRTVTYNDVGSASNGTVITYASGDCSTVP